MYCICRQGGMQFRAEIGKDLTVPFMDAEPESNVEIKDVLLFSDKETVVGRPILENAVVTAKVLSHGRGAKIRVFKRKRRKRYRRTTGHRQKFTTLKIVSMECGRQSAQQAE